jgi:hypothetical protein
MVGEVGRDRQHQRSQHRPPVRRGAADRRRGEGKTTPTTPGDGTDPVTYLLHHGYTQWTSYQPSSRYWTFQWIEFGWLTALALLLLTTALLLVRGRDA